MKFEETDSFFSCILLRLNLLVVGSWRWWLDFHGLVARPRHRFANHRRYSFAFSFKGSAVDLVGVNFVHHIPKNDELCKRSRNEYLFAFLFYFLFSIFALCLFPKFSPRPCPSSASASASAFFFFVTRNTLITWCNNRFQCTRWRYRLENSRRMRVCQLKKSWCL